MQTMTESASRLPIGGLPSIRAWTLSYDSARPFPFGGRCHAKLGEFEEFA
jgi:hypothetical protein